MPVPTDTFWNISRLNKIFAVSAILLLGVMGWAVLQDYDKQWRAPQKSGKVWEAALVSEKLVDRTGTQAAADQLDKDIAAKTAEIQSKEPRYQELTAQIMQMQSEMANLDFKTNTLKAVVGEQMKYLELAKADNDAAKTKELNDKLAEPQKTLAGYIEKQGDYKANLKEAKDNLAKVTADLDALKKDRVKKTEVRDGLTKKLNSLTPDSFVGKVMEQVRGIPLLQFVNPSERVKQQVLPDVLSDLGGFKIVSQIDRCVTCHVNIDKKEFAEDKVLAYLEEQTATSRHLSLPSAFTGKTGDPLATQLKPGAAAMPEFWLKWSATLAPDIVKKPAIANRLKGLAATVGKTAIVTVDGKPLTAFTFAPDASKKDDAASVSLGEQGRLNVAAQLVDAWVKYSKDADAVSAAGPIKVTIAKDVDEKAAATPHKNAMLIAEDLKNSLTTGVSAKQLKLVLDRYRRAMVAEVNTARHGSGLAQLDPSPVMLAHPRLDLYAETDSKHPMEKVGCTSCHDGSGQETRFILAAHTPEPIWVDDSTGAPVLPQELRLAKPMEAEKPSMDNMLHAVYPAEALTPVGVSPMHLMMGDAKAEGPTTKPAIEAAAVPEEAPNHTEPVAYVDPVDGHKGKAVSQLMYWKGKYETESGQTFETTEEEWDFPMRSPKYIQANCVRCHTSVNDIKETAPVLYEGRHLFNNLGCVNCHQMDSIQLNEQRRVGTDLRHVTAKLSPAMINTWIWAPKAFRPTTKMPHFFMLENNSSDEELRRTRQEARAITEYLIQTADPLAPKHIAPTELTGKIEDGRKVFDTIGCLGCHQNLNEPAAGDPKRAGKAVTRGEQWIVQDLVLGGELTKKLTAESGKAPTAPELTAEANKLFDGMNYNERQLYVLEHLDADKNPGGVSTYDDAKKTPKPIFMHHGPELSCVGTKLLADRTPDQAKAWLYDWVKEPRHYSDYTVMPQLRLTDQQAVDLVAYLLDQKRTNTDPGDTWKASLTESDTPKLIELTSLFLRSRFSPVTATQRADDITELRSLATDALTTSLVTKDVAKAKVAAMESSSAGKDELRMVFLGKKLITHYGCMQCHAINGMEAAASPCANLSDWGQKLVSKLDFGYVDPHKSEHMPPQKMMMVNGLSVHSADMTGVMAPADWDKPIAAPVTVAWPEVEHSRESWLTHKLMNTRVWDRGKVLFDPVRSYDNGKMMTMDDGHPMVDDPGKPYDKVKMPTFYLSDEEVTSLVTFVISNRDRLISDKLTNLTASDTAKHIAHGRYLVTEKYNCTTCHVIEKIKPQVQQYYDPSKLTVDAPPSLRGEGNKVQFSWLFNFFKNVQTLRPVLVNGIHMPTFPATDGEWTDILTYFSDVSNKEARELKERVDPVMKYIATAQQNAAVASTDDSATASALAAGDDWFLQPTLQTSAAVLRQWGLDYKQVTDIEIDPLKNSPTDLASGYRKLLYRARFTQDLYAASFPFVDTPHPTVSKERFARGEAFFKEMQCLSCHYLGQPAPGAVPKAPNLNLAHVRLRRDWAQHWVREPDVIQKGTSMPQFFSGAKVDDIHGQTWARASELPPETIARTEAAYGYTPQEQIDLLFDFIYTAGETGYTVVPLAQGEAAPSVTMEKNGEIKVKPFVPTPVKQSAKPAPAAQKSAAAAPEAAPANTGATGTVGGKVTLNGPPPKAEPVAIDSVAECAALHPNGMTNETIVASAKGELKNVIVSVSSGLAGPFPVPIEPAVITQKGCQYTPHVLPMMVGQKLVIRNDDPFLHNVHALSSENPPFNFGQPNKDPGKDAGTFKTVENFRVKCDVHPWMAMNVAVFDNPYFTVSADDGTFTLPPLPAGTYTLTFWHEKFGTQDKEITVVPGKKTEVNISFGP